MTKPISYDVLVIGGGFAGIACAQHLTRRRWRGKRPRVALISDRNYMVFQPLLPEVAGGAISPLHVVNPLRLLCPRADVIVGEIGEISREGHVRLSAGSFSQDRVFSGAHLVLAPGAAAWTIDRIFGPPATV